jgi:hypothetical protein
VVSAPFFFLGPGDFTEPLTPAILHFSTVGSGPTTIRVSGDPSVNPNQGLVYFSGSDSLTASTRVTAAAAVPEPNTIGLAGGALLLLGWCGRFAPALLSSGRISSRRLRS